MTRALGAVVLALAAAPLAATAQQGVVEGSLTSASGVTTGAVVYLVAVDAAPATPPADTAVMDQRNLRFAPRVLVVTPGAAVGFLNGDPILHNVFSPPGLGADFDLGSYATSEVRYRVFHEPGAYVILCNVHPEMVAYVVVVPTPWSAVTDDTGRFRIVGVPAGRYVLHVWQRHLRDPARPVAVGVRTARLVVPVERSRRPRTRRLDDPEVP